jgi:hypothetical protein
MAIEQAIENADPRWLADGRGYSGNHEVRVSFIHSLMIDEVLMLAK